MKITQIRFLTPCHKRSSIVVEQPTMYYGFNIKKKKKLFPPSPSPFCCDLIVVFIGRRGHDLPILTVGNLTIVFIHDIEFFKNRCIVVIIVFSD